MPVCSFALILAFSSDLSLEPKNERGYVPVCSQEDRAPSFTCDPELVVSEALKACVLLFSLQVLKSVCFIVFRGFPILCFHRPLKSLSCIFKDPWKALLSCKPCSTCRVASSSCHSLPTSLLSLSLSLKEDERLDHTTKLQDPSLPPPTAPI
jgi:hypothetical protein